MDAERIALPQQWRDWTIVDLIGEGGSGTVYKAEKSDGVARNVSAIKVIDIAVDDPRASLTRRFRDEEAVRRQLWDTVQQCAGEIRTMYDLQGESNLVSIQDHLVEELENGRGWRLFIRMEYLQSLDLYLTTHEMTENDVVRMGISLCSALEKCAKLNILHLDVKPENILVSAAGEFKLGDFGISRVAAARRDRGASAAGTPHYISPEAAKGQPCGAQADVYSLGLVLYRLMNGNCHPFLDPDRQFYSPNDEMDAIRKRLKGDALPAPVNASPELAGVLLKACAYRPSDRYRSAAAFREALERLLDPTKREAPVPRRRRWIAPAAVGLALLVAVALIVPRLLPGPSSAPAATALPDRTEPAEATARTKGEMGPLSALPVPFAQDGWHGHWVDYRAQPSEGCEAHVAFRTLVAYEVGEAGWVDAEGLAELFGRMLTDAGFAGAEIAPEAVRIRQSAERSAAYVALDIQSARGQMALLYDGVEVCAAMYLFVGEDRAAAQRCSPWFEEWLLSLRFDDVERLLARA